MTLPVAATPHVHPLDLFDSTSDWLPVASGLAKLDLAAAQGALQMKFDFHGGGGFVVARKPVDFTLPERFRIQFRVRGQTPENRFELKLVDPTGENVWWYHPAKFLWSADWETITIESREIEFAWGPAGGGRPASIAALELAIVARAGGAGNVEFASFVVEDLSAAEKSTLSIKGNSATLDLHEVRTFTAIEILWQDHQAAQEYDLSVSSDGTAWQSVREVRHGGGRKNSLYLQETTARYLKLQWPNASEGIQLESISIFPIERVATVNDFLYELAAREPRGAYPKYLLRQQTYWTPISSPHGGTQALINQEGMVEVDRAGFSLEPFIVHGNTVYGWAEGEHEQSLAAGIIPVVTRVMHGKRLTTAAWAVDSPEGSLLVVRYRVENSSKRQIHVRLVAALRPFQVTPPWQAYREFGGAAKIHRVQINESSAVVNDVKALLWLEQPTRVAAGNSQQPSLLESLPSHARAHSAEAQDESGMAWGALLWDLTIPPCGNHEVHLVVPFGNVDAARLSRIQDWLVNLSGAALQEISRQAWAAKLGDFNLSIPSDQQPMIETMRTAAIHILANRDGAALQPGPRRYARSWIRDGAVMGAALLRMGCPEPMRDFIKWYAPFQKSDGNVPCCVDRLGADWLPEHDSHGQWIYAIMEYYRFTKDSTFLSEMQPTVKLATQYLQQLRATRLTAEYESGELHARYGLLPESASHEGYLAHPVHSYWDDFWAIRGFKDAAQLHEILGDQESAAHCREEEISLREAVRNSMQRVIRERSIPHVPGSVEWADFDPTATACAVAQLDECGVFPTSELDFTFNEYLTGWRKRVSGAQHRVNYSAYEIRIIGALIKLGRRHEALELIHYFLADRRPLAWNQWPEITWPDPTSPGHLGDLPHSWIGAEFILAVRSLFAEESGESLIIAAGIPQKWLTGHGIAVSGMPTWFGELNYELRLDEQENLIATFHGDLDPPSGIILQAEMPGEIASISGSLEQVISHQRDRILLRGSPARLVIQFQSATLHSLT